MGCEGSMDIELPEVGPTEETVEALMEYLVGPLLPLKHSDIAKETPSESQQTMVAKQVHAAAVLYNYYHLNHHQEKEFLKFDQFCNLAIMFKPSILQHMKYMRQSDRPVLDDPENQLSLTEKAIMDACMISETLLEASSDVSNMIKEWPITKVAVLLIDSKKENCLLEFNNGVWSVIEKDLYSDDMGIGSESKTGKRRRTGLAGKHDADKEAGFRKLAFSAVKEVAGIRDSKLKVLEGHVVYSLSRAKTATRFYIVQSTHTISEDIVVPIQDAICSLQGPVVKKSLGSWVITPVVEYYYLLPYAEIISEWFSRASNSLPVDQVIEGSADANISLGSQKSCEKMESQSEHIDNSSKESCDGMKPKDMNGSCIIESNDSSSGENDKGVDRPLVCLQQEKERNKMHTPLKVYHHEKKRTTNAKIIKENLMDLKNKSIISEGKDGEKKSCIISPHEDRTLTADHALGSFQPNEFHSTLAAKGSELSEAALRALLKKREKLCDQHQIIEEELALCDKKIQAILHGGIGDCLDLKLETVIDCCNDICGRQDDMQVQEGTDKLVGRGLPFSGKSLSEARLTLRKACQELDDICLTNNWMLPIYHISHSDGGFMTNVTVKGPGFECSAASSMQPSVHQARNSAATHVIAKLQQMAMEPTAALSTP